MTMRQRFGDSVEPSGLRTGRNMITQSERFQRPLHLSYNSALFGVVEPEPESWWREIHPTGAPAMEVIIDNMGFRGSPVFQDQIVILEVSVDNDFPVYVADWGVHLDDKSPYGFSRETKRAYAESLVHLKDYDPAMNYRLPEVVCFKDVPLSQARIHYRDNELMYVARMREKYGHRKRSIDLDEAVPEYTCPIEF